MAPRAFTVSDADFFAGTVALLNSLHRNADGLPLTVLDRGLTAVQRRLLEPHCEIVTGGRDREGYLAKLEAPLRSSADPVVLVDSDVVIVDSIAEPLAAAERGSLFAFREPLGGQRWFAEWSDLFALRAPLRPGPTLNTGFVVLSPARLPSLLPRWAELCEIIAARAAATSWTEVRGTRDDPLWLVDEDACNALLLSEMPDGSATIGPDHGMVMAPRDLAETVVVDRDRWRCEWRGRPVTLLHGVGLRKPWQPAAVREVRRTAYLGALRRFLTGPDLAVRVPEQELVPWLRTGARGTSVRWALHAYDAPARRSRPWRHSRRTARSA
jgi:hypothetical protein